MPSQSVQLYQGKSVIEKKQKQKNKKLSAKLLEPCTIKMVFIHHNQLHLR